MIASPGETGFPPTTGKLLFSMVRGDPNRIQPFWLKYIFQSSVMFPGLKSLLGSWGLQSGAVKEKKNKIRIQLDKKERNQNENEDHLTKTGC